MDLRRTARVEDVHFGQGDDTRGKIRWYVAPPGAKWWTDPTPFRSLDWWDGLSPLPDRPGPVKYQLGVYDKGATPAGVTGQGFCGTADYFENGVPSPPPQLPAGGGSECACCLGVTAGAATFGGASGFSAYSFTPCATPYYNYTAGGTGDPVTLHYPDSAALYRLFLVSLAARAPDPRSLVLSAPAGWIVAADTVNGQFRKWTLYLPDAPGAHDNADFGVSGSPRWCVGTLTAWSGVDPAFAPISQGEASGDSGLLPALVPPRPALANAAGMFSALWQSENTTDFGGQGPGSFYFAQPNTLAEIAWEYQILNFQAHPWHDAGLQVFGPWIVQYLLFADACQPNRNNVAVFRGSGDLSPAGIALRSGAAAIDGSSSFFAVSGIRPGAATFDGSGDLAAVGVELGAGAATFAGSGDLAAVGVELGAGAATFAGSGDLAAVGVELGAGAATFAGSGDLAAVAGTTQSGAATFDGSGGLAAVGSAARSGGATFDGTAVFSPTRNVPVKLRAIGTATVITGGANPTFAGVNLATNEKLIVCVLNVAGGPTGITWGATSLTKDATSTVTVGGRVYGLTVWSLAVGSSGTQTVTVSVGGAASVITAHTLSPITLTAVQASATASGTSTAPNSGATGTPAHSPGALFCAVALHLLNNGTNTIGTWTSPIFNSLDVSLHQTTMTTPLDFWLTTGYRDYAIPDPVSLAAAKTGVTSCEWAAAAVAYE